ncbi:MAG: glycosyl transferase family 2 [Candidatus Marinimicrobia bacterium]|nr:glycosyl transferase family 2 [Candidatus Neomarinimicrobiota bacterium]|tara:strand:- start:10792 stop:11616 length:825 start_codon:yes stop_codon:yes gene_type:complete
MSSELISIIMPVYNCDKYINEAIKSVINQTYKNWELLIVNDGSTDKTKEVIHNFSDPRIKYTEQNNRGVSFARNVALKNMNGNYFCFLDSDDVLPVDSLYSRLRIFREKSDVHFVDGKVIFVNENMKLLGNQFIPCYRGVPFKKLLQISNSCYFGPSWMIRYDPTVKYYFKEGMTHAEDLLFYLTISKTGKYDYTHKPVLYYRKNSGSAMKNLHGLEEGYSNLLESVKQDLTPNVLIYNYLKYRIIRIMFLSHLRNGRDPASAFKSLFRFMFKV